MILFVIIIIVILTTIFSKKIESFSNCQNNSDCFTRCAKCKNGLCTFDYLESDKECSDIYPYYRQYGSVCKTDDNCGSCGKCEDKYEYNANTRTTTVVGKHCVSKCPRCQSCDNSTCSNKYNKTCVNWYSRTDQSN